MIKFREFMTSKGTRVIAGKSAENNEELVKQIEPGNYILHTEKAGSPFCEIKGKASKKELKEVAIFCAKYSHAWRDNKNNVQVHVFKGRDIGKKKDMKIGTFGVKNFKEILVKKKEIEDFEKELGR